MLHSRTMRSRLADGLLEGWFSERGGRRRLKSPSGQAIAYAQSNWTAMPRFTEHRDRRIDNNLAERMLRAQALGRRNRTFLGSDRGGRTAAVVHSFTGTCKHHDIDPFATSRGSRAAPATGTQASGGSWLVRTFAPG